MFKYKKFLKDTKDLKIKFKIKKFFSNLLRIFELNIRVNFFY